MTWPAFLHPLSFAIQLEGMRWWEAVLLFAVLATPVVWLGMRSLNGLGPARKWVAIGVRLVVLLVMVLLLAKARWKRENHNVEVMVLRDVSASVTRPRYFPDPADPKTTLEQRVYDYLKSASDDKHNKRPDDRIGVIRFDQHADIESMPGTAVNDEVRSIVTAGTGTDIASAIQLAMASFGEGSMRRIVLVSDGNPTTGDLDAAINAAASKHIPIDVMPLTYSIDNEVAMERIVAPTWKRQNEAFTLDIFLRSTNIANVSGKLTVTMQGNGATVPLDLAPGKPESPARRVTLTPGNNRQQVIVPGMENPGVYTFKASFEPDRATDNGSVSATIPSGGQVVTEKSPFKGDTLTDNNDGSVFVFVRGHGKVLYIDNVPNENNPNAGGHILEEELKKQGIDIERRTVAQFPSQLLELQGYDAIILANVPHGTGGIEEDQAKLLASYVHDLGGGLLMIGGPDTFGAGGWQGSKLEEVLPVRMDIPAQRQMPKGALVLAMHSCEMPQGNYWGEQCALQAIATLGERDEVGIISYAFAGAGGVGGANWDFPLAEKGDGEKVIKAAKNMQLGDMPSFDDMLELALNGTGPNSPCLRNSDAAQKHIIVISDGDPAAPKQSLIQQCIDNNIAISTITVFTHTPGQRSATMDDMAKQTKGHSYGPIEANPGQLPQIFIKEASTVRRSLIVEKPEGMAVNNTVGSAEITKAIHGPDKDFGLVLTTRKTSPNVEVPWVAGENADPLLAAWQTGLGKAVVYTSDAYNKWDAPWAGSADYAKFWAQAVRYVARPPMSTDFDMQVEQRGTKGHVRINAANKEDSFLNYLNIAGKAVGPDGKARDVILKQTGPGEYEGDFDANAQGSYAVILSYQGPKNNSGKAVTGTLAGGMSVDTSPEQRDLRSNESLLKEIADRTGGRMLKPWDADDADLYSRQGLTPNSTSLPASEPLLWILLALILLDVMVRRIAWDAAMFRRMGAAVAGRVRDLVTVRKVETRQSLDALQRIRAESSESRAKITTPVATPSKPALPVVTRPDPAAKFQATGVEGDIAKVVGGASDKPIPSAPKKPQPKGTQPPKPGEYTGSLLEAKRRAQQQIREREGAEEKKATDQNDGGST